MDPFRHSISLDPRASSDLEEEGLTILSLGHIGHRKGTGIGNPSFFFFTVIWVRARTSTRGL